MQDYISKAEQLDRDDPLGHFRSQFHFPEKGGKPCVYLCGNSLGLQPTSTKQFVMDELQNWQERGVEGHFTGEKPWVSYHHHSKAPLAALLGAKCEEVVGMNNLTTNLHLALSSFYRPKGKRTKILIERGAFPSDFYAVHSQIVQNGLDPKEHLIQLNPRDGSDYLPTSEIIATIEEMGDELATVLFPGVQYYTGQFFDLRAIAHAAHKVGAFAGFDLAHAIGNIPMQLHADEVDFAIWCSYKYLNAGPGGVGGLFVHQRHSSNKTLPRLSGWWGHDAKARFKMDNEINHIPTVDGWQLSNINILSYAALLASLRLFEEAGIEKLRAKSIQLTGFLEEMLQSNDVLKEEIDIITPQVPHERGCQLSLYLTKQGKVVHDRLVERGVVLDWREPNVIRVAPVPFYNSYQDLVKFVSILMNALRHER